MFGMKFRQFGHVRDDFPFNRFCLSQLSTNSSNIPVKHAMWYHVVQPLHGTAVACFFSVSILQWPHNSFLFLFGIAFVVARRMQHHVVCYAQVFSTPTFAARCLHHHVIFFVHRRFVTLRPLSLSQPVFFACLCRNLSLLQPVFVATRLCCNPSVLQPVFFAARLFSQTVSLTKPLTSFCFEFEYSIEFSTF